jgi:putative ABC transport system substrate-binding protein
MNRLRRRMLALGVAVGWPRFASAQQQRKTARIAILTTGTRASAEPRLREFQAGLRELGYTEGKNIVIEHRFTEGKPELLAAYASELVRLNPDCLVSGGIVGPTALMRLTKTIPIVFPNIDSDPVKEGLVASLARPGGNVTGLTGIQWELSGKRIELLKEIVPNVRRIGLLFAPGSASGIYHRDATLAAARKLGVHVELLEIRTPDAIDPAFKIAREAGVDALSVIHVGQVQYDRARVVKLAMDARLPAIYSDTEFARVGGLMSYSPDVNQQHRRAAVFVDKILKGAKPADLPVEQPTKFELVLNMKTAKALGIVFPQTVLLQAERVIQ